MRAEGSAALMTTRADRSSSTYSRVVPRNSGRLRAVQICQSLTRSLNRDEVAVTKASQSASCFAGWRA